MTADLTADARSTRAPVRLGRALLAGLGAGVAGGILAALTWLILGAPAGPADMPLGLGPILISSLILNLLGGLVFYAIARWLPQPALIFAVVGLIFATLYSAMVLFTPAYASFAWVATAMHYVAAVVAIILIPRLAARA